MRRRPQAIGLPPSMAKRQQTATRAADKRRLLFDVVARTPSGALRKPSVLVGPAELTIQMPHRLLTPNAWLWSHWRTKKRAKDAWSARLALAVVSALPHATLTKDTLGPFHRVAGVLDWLPPTNRPLVRITRFVPTRRHFITDRENRFFAAKALVDCLVQAGFLVNDRERDIDLRVDQAVSPDGMDWTEVYIDARAPEHRATVPTCSN